MQMNAPPWLALAISDGRSAFGWPAAWVMVWLLTGCAAPGPLPVPPELVAPVPAPAAPSVPPAVSRALVRDSAAVQANARQYVAKPSTSPASVLSLEPLTQQVNRARAVLELHRRREGRYRPADVRAARAAADQVARFLSAQPVPLEKSPP